MSVLKNIYLAISLLLLAPLDIYCMFDLKLGPVVYFHHHRPGPVRVFKKLPKVSEKTQQDALRGISFNLQSPVNTQPNSQSIAFGIIDSLKALKLSPSFTSSSLVQEPKTSSQPLVDRLIIQHPTVDIKMPLDVLTTEFIMHQEPKTKYIAGDLIIAPLVDIDLATELIMEQMPKLTVNPSANNEIVCPAIDIGWSELFPLIEAQAQANYYGKIRVNGIKYSNTDNSVVVENMDKEFSTAQLLKAEVINAIKAHPYMSTMSTGVAVAAVMLYLSSFVVNTSV
jgi:hypothetical protein